MIKAAVLVVSDRVHRNEMKDLSVPVFESFVNVIKTDVVPDEIAAIRAAIIAWKDSCADVDVIFTTGGTGFGVRDAIAPLLERLAPGVVIAIINASLNHTPFAMLSRPVAGMIGQVLIVTLPGSPKACNEILTVLSPVLPHAVHLLHGGTGNASHALMKKISRPIDGAENPMIQFDEALFICLSHAFVKPSIELGVSKCSNYVAAKDICAPIDFPNFRAAIVDGYATKRNHSNRLKVVGSVMPGATSSSCFLVTERTCVYITTGALIPDSAECVIMVEDVVVDGEEVTIVEKHDLSSHRCSHHHNISNIREVGSDTPMGAIINHKNTLLDHIVLQGLGVASVSCYPKPVVVVVSTGPELEPIDSHPILLKPGMVRDVNRPFLLQLLARHGFEAVDYGISKCDTFDATEKMLRDIFDRIKPDVVVTTGGVSMGNADFVKGVLRKNARVLFERISMKPGKPTMFATWNQVPIFGLPGNPVSAIVTALLLVIPFLKKMSGMDSTFRYLAITKIDGEVVVDSIRLTFVRASLLLPKNGEIVARIAGAQQSSRFLSMDGADALLEIPSTYVVGDTVRAILI